MNPRHPALALASTLALAGCGVPLAAPASLGPVNTCTADRDCGDGATCTGGVCAATSFDLANLRIEVRPHANAAYGATTSYILDPGADGVALTSTSGSSQPFLARYDARLPKPISIVKGRIVVDKATKLDPNCHLDADRAVPGKVTFYRISSLVGFPLDPITVEADPTTNDIDVDLVPGTYDVYVQPSKVDGCNGGNAYPPVLLTNQTIASGGVGFTLPTPRQLSGTVLGLEGAGEGQWVVDLVEPKRGLVISASMALDVLTDGYAISAQISWPDTSMEPILRLAPPDGTTKPTIYWSLAGAIFDDNGGNPTVNFSAAQLDVQAVEVEGLIQDATGQEGVAAQLTIQSKNLQGPIKQNAAYSFDGLMADAVKGFNVKLPPGDYDIRAFPLVDDGLAVTNFTLSWPKGNTDCVCGGTFNLAPKVSIGGSVTTATGVPLNGAPVSFTPSQPGAATYWSDTHALDTVATRSIATQTDDFGRFSLQVDPGQSDLSIQPDPDSNFPWLVLPRLDLESDAETSTFALTSPGFLTGTIVDPDGVPVANAQINAWFPVRDPKATNGLTNTVVQIATTSTDANGKYTLVLPSSI